MKTQEQNIGSKGAFAPMPVLQLALFKADPVCFLPARGTAAEAPLAASAMVSDPGGSLISGFTTIPGMDVRLRVLPPLWKGESGHGDNSLHMMLRDLYRQALEHGGDAISRALGHAEAELARNPANRQALTYKGSLLTMVGEAMLSEDRRRDYIRSGLAMMHTAMAFPGSYPTVAWELDYLRATTLAMLPPELGHDNDALILLRALCSDPAFAEQSGFERTRSLSLLACQAELAQDPDAAREAFTTARAIDEPLAIKTYADWQERCFAPPSSSAPSDP